MGSFALGDIARMGEASASRIDRTRIRESRSPRLLLTQESPAAFRAGLRDYPAMMAARDLDTLRDAIRRLSLASEAVKRSGLGRGWTATECLDAMAAIEALVSRGKSAAEADPVAPQEELAPEDLVHFATFSQHLHGERADGSHAHAFVHEDILYVTDIGGAHEHEPGEDDSQTTTEADHEHPDEQLPDGRAISFGTPSGHDHVYALPGTTYTGGEHRHDVLVDGEKVTATLDLGELRASFQAVEAVRFLGGMAERVGQSVVPTSGLSLREWWAKGHGSPKVRRALGQLAAGEAVVSAKAPATLEIGGQEEGFRVVADGKTLATFERATDAAFEAIASLGTRADTVLVMEGDRVLHAYTLAGGGAAAESLVRRAMSARAAWGEMVALEAVGDDAWLVDIVVAGLSKNDNFWPADVLRDELVAGLEGAVVRAFEFTGKQFDHLWGLRPGDLPAGVSLNTVGILRDVVFEEDGGTVPDDEALEAIAAGLDVDVEEIRRRSVGRLRGVFHVADTAHGRDVSSLAELGESLGQHVLEFSIATMEATPVAIYVGPGRSVSYRRDVKAGAGVYLDVVSHGAAGGALVERAA